MKSLTVLSTLCLALAAGSAHAAPVKGSTCVDVAVTASCSKNVVSGSISLKNCGAGADTIVLSETLVDPSGAVISQQGASAYLKAGKTTQFSAIQPLPADMPAGVYTLNVSATATKGGGTDSAVISLSLPCP